MDTSVALKWFLLREEADRDRALGLRAACLEGRCRVRAPELLAIELANVLVTGARFTASQVFEAVVDVQELGIEFDPLRWHTLELAIDLSFDYRAAVYDCYFLALAVERQSMLVTADESFLRKAGKHPRIVRLSQVQLPPRAPSET